MNQNITFFVTDSLIKQH